MVFRHTKGFFHMKRIGIAIATVLMCAFVSAGQAFGAATAAADTQEVPVHTGGIGDDELQALRAREKEFNLKLVFSLVQGNYLADVDVVVVNERGAAIIERLNTGPILLARLPAGEYNITVSHDGKTVSRKVRIATGRLRTEHVVRWPADPERDLPVSRWLDRE